MKTFDELFAELSKKKLSNDETSFTCKSLAKGTHFIGKKIVEEAAEVWMAAEYESKEECAEEISQLLYHLQVLMLDKDISLEEIYKYL